MASSKDGVTIDEKVSVAFSRPKMLDISVGKLLTRGLGSSSVLLVHHLFLAFQFWGDKICGIWSCLKSQKETMYEKDA